MRRSPEFCAEQDLGAEELVHGRLNGVPVRQFVRRAAG